MDNTKKYLIPESCICPRLLLLLLVLTSALSFAQESTPLLYPETQSRTQYNLGFHEQSELLDNKADLVPCTIHNYSHSWIHISIRAATSVYFEGTLAPQISEGSMWGEMVSGWPTDTLEIALPPRRSVISLQTPYIDWTLFTVELERSKAFTYTIDAEAVGDSNPVLAGIENGLGIQASQSAANKSAVGSAIDKVSQGPHQELPPPAQSSAVGQGPGWTFENASGQQLVLYLSGPTQRQYKVSNGQTILMKLFPGTYRIAVEVSDTSVLPYYAVRQLSSDTRWKSTFHIPGH